MTEMTSSVKLTKSPSTNPCSNSPTSDKLGRKVPLKESHGDKESGMEVHIQDAPAEQMNHHDLGIPEVVSSPRPLAALPSSIVASKSQSAAIDPISRQISERTKSHQSAPRLLPLQTPDLSFSSAQKPPAATSAHDLPERYDLQRNGSTSSVNRGSKDKKKGVSLFSRFIGNKKKDAPESVQVEPVSPADSRATEADLEVFSRPIGFVPQFPAPPRYIKVKANNRKQRDFERVFLAQVILEREQKGRRKTGDEEILHIDDAPTNSEERPNRAIWAMEFSKDGRYLAVAGQDKKVRVWAVISSKEERRAHEVDEEEKASEQAGVRLNAPALRTKPIREYQGHTSSVLDLSWSKNNFLLSSSMDKTVRLWHVTRDECLCAFKHHDFVTSIAFHPRDDRFFLAGSLDAKLRLWSIPDKTLAYCANVPDMITAVSFTPDGKTCIAGCLNGLCLFFDTDRLKLHSQLHVRSARGRNAKGSKITGIDTISLPPGDLNGDVKLLITSNDSRIRLYNYKDRNLEIKFRGNENTCSQIHATFSDDGKYVICGSEDKRVYIWPIGPTEKQDQDKRPVEILEAHSAIVTCAILAPTRTRQHLAVSSDPIYDLCNPPPVTLVGNDSPFSSRTHTESNRSIKEQAVPPMEPPVGGTRRAEETPAYLARHAHPGGNFVFTGDYLGQIKVFRQDCAFQKRRYELFDSTSLFSRNRLLRRSGSTTTRTSLSSARNSITYSHSKNPSTDRIINWRNSVTNVPNSNSVTKINGEATKSLNRARSDSPRKAGNYVASPLQPFVGNPPPTSATSVPSTHPKSSDESEWMATAAGLNLPGTVLIPGSPKNSLDTSQDASIQPLADGGCNSLSAQGDHSYRYWNQDELAAMAQRAPRTPGLLDPDNINGDLFSRKRSVVSKLSSELSSDETPPPELDREGSDEIKCKSCGGKSFRVNLARRAGVEEKRLSCKRCGEIV